MKPKKAEELLGITRPTLLQKVKDYKLDVPKTKSGQHIFRWKHLIQYKFKDMFPYANCLNSKESEDNKNNMKTKIISICQNKGGVGKTSSVLNLAYAFSFLGKTLVIDMDGQSNLSQAFDIYLSEEDLSLTDVFEDTNKVNDAIQEVQDNLYLLPNHLKFEKWKKSNRGNLKTAFILKKIIRNIKSDYQFIFIDTPSALDLSIEIALYASNYCVIPFEPQPFSLEGITNILDEIEYIKDNDDIADFDLKILGIFINLFEKTNLSLEISELVSEKFDVFKSKIRKGVAVQQAQAVKESIFDYDENSYAALDYYNLTFEILEKIIEV